MEDPLRVGATGDGRAVIMALLGPRVLTKPWLRLRSAMLVHCCLKMENGMRRHLHHEITRQAR